MELSNWLLGLKKWVNTLLRAKGLFGSTYLRIWVEGLVFYFLNFGLNLLWLKQIWINYDLTGISCLLFIDKDLVNFSELLLLFLDLLQYLSKNSVWMSLWAFSWLLWFWRHWTSHWGFVWNRSSLLDCKIFWIDNCFTTICIKWGNCWALNSWSTSLHLRKFEFTIN